MSSFYLKINSEYFYANDPKIIFLGKSYGALEIIDIHKEKPADLKYYQIKAIKKIFICESIKMALRPLIPYTAGFVFKEGSTLHHFANILRHNHIPACIDPSLWKQAKHMAGNHETRIYAELNCGKDKEYSTETRDDYCQKLNYYLQKIENNPLKLTVYNLKNNQVCRNDKSISLKLGLKALSVNSLLNQGLPVPETLILNNMEYIPDDDIINDSIEIINKKFPQFGQSKGFNLMIRASLHSSQKSKTTLSGLISSYAVQNEKELERVLEEYTKLWKEINSDQEGIRFSMIVQERIKACVLGIIFTRLPWDYHSNKMIIDLTFFESNKELSKSNQLIINDFENLISDGKTIKIDQKSMNDLEQILPAKLKTNSFYTSFSQFLNNCHELENFYGVPLDIEFAMNDNLQFYFIQFRHIFQFL